MQNRNSANLSTRNWTWLDTNKQTGTNHMETGRDYSRGEIEIVLKSIFTPKCYSCFNSNANDILLYLP